MAWGLPGAEKISDDRTNGIYFIDLKRAEYYSDFTRRGAVEIPAGNTY
jgi:hypothetical protein